MMMAWIDEWVMYVPFQLSDEFYAPLNHFVTEYEGSKYDEKCHW